MDNVDNLQDKSILSFPQKVISWTLYSTLYAGLLGSSAYVALRYAQNYLALNKQSSSPDSISLGQKQR